MDLTSSDETLRPQAKSTRRGQADAFWWKCPECKEVYAAPANQASSNIIGCERCNLVMNWKDVKEKW